MQINPHDDTLSLLQEIADVQAQKVILSVIDRAKSAQEIALENGLPLSSTYKKIRRLCKINLLCVDTIQLDDSGKKIFLYRSKIRSCQFLLRVEGSTLRFEKNDGVCAIEGIKIR
jgi:hypothetical protein